MYNFMKFMAVMRTFVLLFIATLIAGSIHAQKHQRISIKELESMIQEKKNFVLIDVRTSDEIIEYGMIAGARQIDYFQKDFEKQLLSLDKGQTYVVYCASGARSGEAAELLTRNGFGNIYEFHEGFNAWRKAKKPIQHRKTQ